MRSDPQSGVPARPIGPTGLGLAIALATCGAGDTEIGCDPTLTCSIDAERFERKVALDGGTPECGAEQDVCEADKLSLGLHHGCAIAPGGQLLCWGDDAEGQLGGGSGRDGEVGDAGISPVLTDVREVSAGGAHTCALADSGDVYCWGRNAEGQVDGTPSEEPLRLPVEVGVAGATGVAAGGAHSCALTPRGVTCWGSAERGQAGRAVQEGALSPGLVAGTGGATQVSAGLAHTCALLAGGAVVCWGELLDPDSGERVAFAEPVAVPGLDDAIQISAGAGFTCALRQGGRGVCWGENDSGQLGDGTRESSPLPVDVAGLETSLEIRAGGGERDGQRVGHACSLTKGFFMQCWGRNVEGQLGVGPGDDSPVPVLVMGEAGDEDDEPLLPDVTTMAAGGFFTCSIDHDGPVLCWGDDSRGQRGMENPGPFGRVGEVDLFRD